MGELIPYWFRLTNVHKHIRNKELAGEISALIMGQLHDVRFLRDPQAAHRTEASWERLVKSYQA